MRHTVIVSDIHLCEVEPGSGAWMRHRQRPFLPDQEIAELFDALARAAQGEPLSLVLNGDVFDFDAPRVVGQASVVHDLPRDAEHGVPALAAILDDHPLFVRALARLLEAGHEVVFISGNHDILLTLPEVRSLLASRLVDTALSFRERPVSPSDRALIAARIHFRAWFHKTNDNIVVEHGHLYDPYCTYRYPMAPFLHGSRTIVPTMGSMGTRLLVSSLGYFNPHVDSTINLSKIGYLMHWARYYLFTRRSIALIWATGTAHILWSLVRVRPRSGPSRAHYRGNLLACARETSAGVAAIGRHARLFETPAEERVWECMRELWVDRISVLLLGLLLGAAWLLIARLPWGLLGLLLPPIALITYDRLSPKPPLAETWLRIGRAMRRIAQIHSARAVIFGHTHNPEGSWEGDAFYGNSGSWSAAFADAEGRRVSVGERPIIWLRSDEKQRLFGGLYVFRGGSFEPRVVRSEPEELAREGEPERGQNERASHAG